MLFLYSGFDTQTEPGQKDASCTTLYCKQLFDYKKIVSSTHLHWKCCTAYTWSEKPSTHCDVTLWNLSLLAHEGVRKLTPPHQLLLRLQLEAERTFTSRPQVPLVAVLKQGTQGHRAPGPKTDPAWISMSHLGSLGERGEKNRGTVAAQTMRTKPGWGGQTMPNEPKWTQGLFWSLRADWR